jgi:hypothetical protein
MCLNVDVHVLFVLLSFLLYSLQNDNQSNSGKANIFLNLKLIIYYNLQVLLFHTWRMCGLSTMHVLQCITMLVLKNVTLTQLDYACVITVRHAVSKG